MEPVLATSRYTFRLPLADGYALYSASTGSVLRFQGPDAAELTALLAGPRALPDADELGDVLTAQLRRNGFLIASDVDELGAIRERYQAARGDAPVSLLVTTTMECNLGCFYCYETRSQDALHVTDVEQLVAIARERLARAAKTSLHVDWYGGEPMMNLPFLEQASAELQALCAAEGIRYQASAISNGTLWPDDIGPFVARHKLRQVQITFDGLKEHHDRRRRYRAEHRPAPDASSFEQTARLVDRLVQHTRVDLRYNADPANADDLAGFIDFAAERGWFDAPFRCVVMVARLAAYTDRSAFMRQRELSDEGFEALQAVARAKLPREAQDDQDIVHGFPVPRTSVCGALAVDSTVVGADGLEYRCGLQVGETHRAVGRFGGARDGEQFQDLLWWDTFDPTTLPTCSRCSFLPVCWGGCPKRHLDGSRPDIERESRFWRVNLPRMIAAGFGEQPPAGFVYTEADQYRDGPVPGQRRSIELPTIS